MSNHKPGVLRIKVPLDGLGLKLEHWNNIQTYIVRTHLLLH